MTMQQVATKTTLPRDITMSKAEKIGIVIDHLVDALGGEPGCTMRRAVVLADIDEHPGTTQADIMKRLEIDKSTLNRDIEWLYDYGCIMRRASLTDARVQELTICGYAKKNFDFALFYFDYDHKSLKNFLIRFIHIFDKQKPTLRDAKIVSFLGDKPSARKQEILDDLYDGPSTTDNRAINNLVDFGIVEKRK